VTELSLLLLFCRWVCIPSSRS